MVYSCNKKIKISAHYHFWQLLRNCGVPASNSVLWRISSSIPFKIFVLVAPLILLIVPLIIEVTGFLFCDIRTTKVQNTKDVLAFYNKYWAAPWYPPSLLLSSLGFPCWFHTGYHTPPSSSPFKSCLLSVLNFLYSFSYFIKVLTLQLLFSVITAQCLYERRQDRYDRPRKRLVITVFPDVHGNRGLLVDIHIEYVLFAGSILISAIVQYIHQ